MMRDSIKRKIQSLQFMSTQINIAELERAESACKEEDEQGRTLNEIIYKRIHFDLSLHGLGIAVSLNRVEYSRYNKCFSHRHESSWTSIPYDVLCEIYGDFDNITDEQLSGVTTLIRKLYKHSWEALKFGTYVRSFNAVDYLNFEVKK